VCINNWGEGGAGGWPHPASNTYVYVIDEGTFLLSTFYCPRSSPHPSLSEEREGEGQRGVYKKGKEFSIYILYIYNINIYV